MARGHANVPLSAKRTKMGDIRVRANIPQRELAERTGLSLTTINRIEGGRVADPGVIDLLLIARELGCTLDDLIEDCWREGLTLKQAALRDAGQPAGD